MTGPTTAVCTVVRGRPTHLRNLLVGLAQQVEPADRIVVATTGGPDATAAAAGLGTHITWVDAAAPDTDLPLTSASNAARAAAGDVDQVIVLDVDIVPHPRLVADYRQRIHRRPAVWSGQVQHLPAGADLRPAMRLDPTALDRLARQDPTQPRPPRDRPLPRPQLFRAQSFGAPAALWDRLHGFDEGFRGYGAADTDLALRAEDAGFQLWQTPDARGWRQHRPTRVPPLEHLPDIVRNSCRFQARWGHWPMEGWLRQMRDEGLVRWLPRDSHLSVTVRGWQAHREAVADAGPTPMSMTAAVPRALEVP